MNHDEAFRAGTPTFADPVPGCNGGLELVARDRPVLAGGGWASARQEVYRCRSCGCRLGLLDGRVAWVERRLPAAAPDENGKHSGPTATRSTGRAGPGSPSIPKVLEAIRRLAGADGACTAGNVEIEREAGITRRTAQYALAHLARSGAIRIEGGTRALDGRRIIPTDPGGDGPTPGPGTS
ncbi:2Fe-2S iron-sulfur cluster-binding family protein [Tautonia plasticadhaerens]|uniref:Uncharacterized protein n=1 Tax=Tautonia plasticadhaerens TaxID=2527974 RepID=A0A518GZN5_9BACT|nr:hypothetical protein [Tautonia plasticadhaerens]QDV34054.1 hypothetical protein ElP_19350 [Tautonia plasticadhaerens]